MTLCQSRFDGLIVVKCLDPELAINECCNGSVTIEIWGDPWERHRLRIENHLSSIWFSNIYMDLERSVYETQREGLCMHEHIY
eukprot:c46094_g1_i1 orf=3-248(-)